MTSSVPSPTARPAPRFATTRWSLIRQARQNNEKPARAALEELCQAYWLPVYGFMRKQTSDVHEAQDWTQGFFASLLSRNAFAELDPSFGRFRSFLLAAARHFASNERDKNQSVQRGGRLILQSIDYEEGERQLANELTRGAPAEVLFERQWALAILDRVLNRLRQEYHDSDRSLLFDALAEHLSGTATDELLCEVASRLQLSSEAVRVSLHRLRKRYRHLLRDEIGQTTESADDVDDEIRHLFRVLSR